MCPIFHNLIWWTSFSCFWPPQPSEGGVFLRSQVQHPKICTHSLRGVQVTVPQNHPLI